MALSESDLDRIKDKLRLAINEYVPPIVKRAVTSHEADCGYGKKLTRATWILIGAAGVITALNGGSILNLLKTLF